MINCMYTRVYMAKLYWRVKRDGKWTWIAFDKKNSRVDYSSSSGWAFDDPTKEEAQ